MSTRPAPAHQPSPAPELLAELLHSTAIHLLRHLRKADESSGTTSTRLSALSVIVFSGPITLGALAQAEQVRPPTMTRIVHALEQQQLVIKSRDPGDHRLIRIAATTRGRRLLLAARNRRVRLLAARIRRIDPAARATLHSALATLQTLIETLH